MRAFRMMLLLAAAVGVASCNLRQQIPLTFSNPLTTYADQIRQTAGETFEYAQLSSNAYHGSQMYALDDSIREIGFLRDDEVGFGYALYERIRDGRPVEHILAFRGTDFGQPRDWYCGNVFTCQNNRGLALFRSLRAKFPAVPMTVTGHSLGGGIATYVSLVEPNVKSRVFNTSPRFKAPRHQAQNDRISVNEFGDPLKIGRIFGREADQRYVSIGCTRSLNPIAQHRIRNLANCLTAVSAFDRSDARASMRRNPQIPLLPNLNIQRP